MAETEITGFSRPLVTMLMALTSPTSTMCFFDW